MIDLEYPTLWDIQNELINTNKLYIVNTMKNTMKERTKQ